MERSWILVGMMGSGKTTVGQRLSKRTGREFIDTDKLMQHKLGHSIPSLFRIYGEGAFRDHETSLLRSMEPGPFVLATGGGIVLKEENWKEMRRLGVTLFLDVEIGLLLERLSRGRRRRPLLTSDDWEQKVRDLLASRRPHYERADIVIHLTDESADQAAQKAYEELNAWSS